MSSLQPMRATGALTSASPGQIGVSESRTLATPAPMPEVNFWPVVLMLWRGRWIVVAFVVVGVLAAYVYLRGVTPVFASSTRVHVQRTLPKLIGDAELPIATSLDTESELIHSTAVLALAARSSLLDVTTSLAGVDNRIAWLKEAISVEARNEFLTITAKCASAQDAATIANTVAEAYIDYRSSAQKTTTESLRILQKEKARYEESLAELSQRELSFRQQHPELMLSGDSGSAAGQRLVELSSALTATELELIDARSAAESLQQLLARTSSPAELAASLAPGAVRQAQARVLEQEAQVYRLRNTFGPQHRAVLDAQRALDQLRAVQRDELEALTLAARAEIESRLSRAQRRHDALRRSVEEYRLQALGTSVSAAELQQIQANTARLERMLEVLDSRIKELNLTEDAGAINITVLETAKPDEVPVHPNRARMLGVAMCSAGLLGMGLVVLLDRLDQRVRTTEDATAASGLPILAVIPRMERGIAASQRGRQVQLQPHSHVAEAYRAMRTAIHFGLGERYARSILITSPLPGDGKSTLASNLALAMAQVGRRVLLIDGDCRRPTQHTEFQLGPAPGLVALLSGQCTLQDAVQHVATNDKLSVLAVGAQPPNPAELLNSQAFVRLLEEAGQVYDQIIIDSPPVVPVTDGRIIAAYADAVILVMRSEQTTRRAGRHAVECLQAVGANLVGVALNGASSNAAGYGYGYDYGYHYGRSPHNRPDDGQTGRSTPVARTQLAGHAAAVNGV